ncbi:DUF6179 domain-containing protein [[Clostridium] symbiosum]|uniref:DUF6179 domain-containing protein n=1 Tax=Clostridium symbiosum TaxID=1512 RepID=UPI0025A37ADD|nr:DUF6179 domain-containing protein [[Clostridium] symbiosum]MDM8136475.1 DUF6179 domain-containing protein [[Clostridium] symbiosum]MDM8140546.1 DUF6179 domain-containing protein [[Clostridium] symbiosum]MDM8320554.1 DUF6179 domain-containing protein [[Clostridium] symbiosum]
MSTLDIWHTIKPEQLNSRCYFQSLLEQARFCGLLSDAELSKIQTELLLILAGQTDKWSQGKSSSIPTEKAQELLTSAIFVIGIQLKSYQTPENAVEGLKTEPLKSLFEKGLHLVHRKIAISRHRQKRIAAHLLNTPNVYYRSTIIDGINGFFKLYRSQFNAHEIHITADYPTYLGRPNFDGIEFIERYLRCIEAENEFCMHFAPQDIHHLLCGLTPDYRSVPMNLFEPVFLCALGLAILHRNPERLDLSQDDIVSLYQFFSGKSNQGIQSILRNTFCDLDRKMELPEISNRYIHLCIPKLAETIQKSVALKTMDKVFLVPAYPEREPKISISYGERMNDIKYQSLIDNILQADDSQGKVELILQEVHSLADLLDVLSDAELYKEDFELLTNLLPTPVFVALLNQYPSDDFLERESEKLLYAALQNRKKHIPPEEMRQIKKVTAALKNGNIGRE